MGVKLKQIIKLIEDFAPLSYQESYDNSGLLLGKAEKLVNSALLCLELDEQVLQEAIDLNADLIITHHPLIFKGIKKLRGDNAVERIIIEAIKRDIAIYVAHTNLDSVRGGVSERMADVLELKNKRILAPANEDLRKLVVFVPENHADLLREAIFKAGAGKIGNYDSCSFNAEGFGSFKAGDEANPFVDFKYHQFFEAEDDIIIADIGHYESEQFTPQIFYDLIIKKIPNFA
ncbi:unnamed protein product, partial [Cyprideis torosa]